MPFFKKISPGCEPSGFSQQWESSQLVAVVAVDFVREALQVFEAFLDQTTRLKIWFGEGSEDRDRRKRPSKNEYYVCKFGDSDLR